MFRLAGALGRAGHEVHVIAGPSTFGPVEQANVLVHRISSQHELTRGHRALHWLYWRGFARFMTWLHPAIWHWIKWDLASYQALRQLDAMRPLDLVEVPEHAANGWMAGKIHRWPIVMRVHCPWDLFVRINRFAFNPMHRVLAKLERKTVASVPDALTVPSEAMRRELTRSWALRRQPIIVPNFMDVPASPSALPAESDDVQRIVCIGRIEPLKGQDVLARAFGIVARRHPKLRLQIVGPDRWPGKQRFAELLPELVPDADIRRRIELPGTVPLAEVMNVLREARLAVVASRGFESFSFAALEAMASARPIVSTNVGALPELIDHERTGLVVPSENAELLAAAMERMLMDRRASEAMGLAAYERARERYHTPRVMPKILAAYADGGDYFYQVRAARGEGTARQWRRAAEAVQQAKSQAA
jgi:glycosyltransferase involved in cell wall biosynthesis